MNHICYPCYLRDLIVNVKGCQPHSCHSLDSARETVNSIIIHKSHRNSGTSIVCVTRR